MAKEITLHFGEYNRGEFPEFKLGNTLVIGRIGSGKSVLVRNILSELILRYDPEDILVDIYDGKAVEFVTNKKDFGIKHCKISNHCFNYAECGIEQFIDKKIEDCNNVERKLLGTNALNWRDYNAAIVSKTPHIGAQLIIIEEADAILSALPDGKAAHALNKIKHIMVNAERFGIYVMISSSGFGFLNSGIITKDDFDIVACTRVNEEESERLFGSSVGTLNDCKYGKVCVRDQEFDVNVLNVPFYYKVSKIRDIVNGEILPKGAMFNKDKLDQWQTFMRGSFVF